eukprot:CAMPEP_0184293286 /NCGR_PEP_ID=MMETSP1049-20130417/4773_1 /TAXON_ID=77928 /ORGANISM="Proteomonas sulcata, Strain CCMP704" /LENGTH=283 /DNA_ID=CAMNT_0026601237 /DNA_START=123 /DNA_END=974 /DNA_ORIENTATION=-
MTVACARNSMLCQVESVSKNHMGTEMPCRMFLLLSSKGAHISLLHPTAESEAFPEALVVEAQVHNFEPGRDGYICFTWPGNKKCGTETFAVLLDLQPGLLSLRAELLGHDGLPVASSGDPIEIQLELAMSASMDWEGPILDSRVDLPAAGGRAVAGQSLVIGSGCVKFVEELRIGSEYTGEVAMREWATACHQSGNEAQAYDFVYLCPPALASQSDLETMMEFWVSQIRPGGTLAGAGYFAVVSPGGEDLHSVKSSVDSFFHRRDRAVQVTQEMTHRSWFVML